MTPTLTIIGTVNSTLKTLEDCPLQERKNAPEATITILLSLPRAFKTLKPETRF